MHTIVEEESFLPAIVSNDPTKQLAQVKRYYDRQQRLAFYLTKDIEDIRMAYSLKLFKEKERLRKSLWELDNKKRRIFHQIVQKPSQPSWKWKYPAREVPLIPPQKQTNQTVKRQKKEPPDNEIKPGINIRRIVPSRLDTQHSRLPSRLDTQHSRLETRQSGVVTRQSFLERPYKPKPKKKENLARPVVPQFLFC